MRLKHRGKWPPSRWWKPLAMCMLGLWLTGCGNGGEKDGSAALADDATLARAGAIHRAATGSAIVLTPRTEPQGQRYSWNILARPKSSRTELTDKSASNPRIVPDKPGTYVVELVESKDGKRGRRQLVSVEVENHVDESHEFDHDHATTECIECHNEVNALGKPVNHILSTEQCAACHSSDHWRPVVTVAHEAVLGKCDGCHNGVAAVGKSALHLPTTLDCNNCHVTDAWTPAVSVPVPPAPCPVNMGGGMAGGGGMGVNPACVVSGPVCPTPGGATTGACGVLYDHSKATGTCVSCHNNTVAKGKSATHIMTTDRCDACHSVIAWVATRVDHVQTLGSCETCHTAPANHTAVGVTAQCGTCHATATWFSPLAALPDVAPGTGGFIHPSVAQECMLCHNGVDHRGKGVAHIATTNSCGACHTTMVWLPAAKVDHRQVIGRCFDCHNSVIASGMSATHILVVPVCENCHSTVAWAPVVSLDHSVLLALGTCGSCHNGLVARGTPMTHVATMEECNRCHSVNAWLPTIALVPVPVAAPIAPVPTLPAPTAPTPAPTAPMPSTMALQRI
ncbi:MAG: hypothetical protein OEW08_07515 [Gammaproteobacteria bacterium]|nr:hypothetical protein [Gammaproteobacteria bacterium]